MKIGVYVINLARSRARWDGLSHRAGELGIALERVEGVDGTACRLTAAGRRQVLASGGTMITSASVTSFE